MTTPHVLMHRVPVCVAMHDGELIVVCNDGAVFGARLGGGRFDSTMEWHEQHPVPGTQADRQKAAADDLRKRGWTPDAR